MTDVRVERVGHVDLFTPFDPPDVRHALRFQSYDAVELAVREMTAHCLVITGANPAFCSRDDVRGCDGRRRRPPAK